MRAASFVKAAIPVLDDPVRLRAVDDLQRVGRPSEDRFDRVTRTLGRVLGAPVCLLNLVTGDAVEVVSSEGIDLQRVERDGAPCAHVVQDGRPLLVEDTTADARIGTTLAVGPHELRSYAGVPLHGPTGHVVGTLCVFDVQQRRWDETDLAALGDLARWAESELAREDVQRRRAADALAVDRMKDDILCLVSHELRTPLTSLQGALGLLTGEVLGPLSAPGRQVAGIALASTERLVRLVDDICDLERLAAGQVTVRRRPEQLADVVRAAVDAVGPLAAQASVTVREEVRPGAAWLDGGRVTQVLSHLLANAVQASSAGDLVRVRARAGEDAVVLEVEDWGCGIAEQDLDRVFGSFTRVDASDSRAHSGTGLGLALARSVVEAHGGRLSARSALGRGATFTVELPQRSPRPDEAAS